MLEEMHDEDRKALVEMLTERSDEFFVSRMDKIMHWVMLGLILPMAIVTLFFTDKEKWGIAVVVAMALIVGAIFAKYPKIVWKFQQNGFTGDVPYRRWTIFRKISYWVLFAAAVGFFFMILFVE